MSLTYTSESEEIRARQIRGVNQNMPRIALASFAVASLFAYMASTENANGQEMLWLALQVLVVIYRIAISYTIHKNSLFDGVFPQAGIISGIFFSGIVWGAGLFLLGDNPTQFAVYASFLIFSGLVAASGISTSIYLPAFYGFLIPVLTISTIWFISGNIMLKTEMQVFALLYVIGIVFFTSSLSRQFVAQIRTSIENERLAADLNGAVEKLQEEVDENSRRSHALSHSETQFRMLIELVPDAVLLANTDGKIVYNNHSAEEMFGYQGGFLSGHSVEELVPETIAGIHKGLRQSYIANRKSTVISMKRDQAVKGKRSNGSVFPVEVGVFPIILEGNRFFAALVRDLSRQQHIEELHREVKERERVERQLRQLLEDHELITSSVQDVMFHLGRDGRVLWTNPAFQECLQKSSAQLDGQLLCDYVVEEEKDIFDSAVAKVLSGNVVDFDVGIKTGEETRYFHFSGTPVKNDNGMITRFTGIGRDVTERRNAAEQLRQSQRRFEVSQEFSNVGTWEINLKTGEMFWSRQIWSNAGLLPEKDKATRQNYFSHVPKVDRRAIIKSAMNCIRGKGKLDVRHRIVAKDHSSRWVQLIGDIESDDEGRPYRLLGVLINIDQIKKAEDEQRALKLQLMQSQKMESIGLMTGGIAHDFNNMLTSIMGYAKLMTILPDEDASQHKEYLDRINSAGERASDMVKQLLAFSREKPDSEDQVCLNAEIESSIAMLKPVLPSSIEIRTEINLRNVVVVGSAVQLQQSLMNLCINARDAMEGKGILTIRLKDAPHVNGNCNSCFKPFDGDYVVVEVEDTGSGISRDLIDRIFDPFLTTKDVGKGSGMGLSMVHGIVHQHGGHIQVESQPGRTCFRIYVPCVEASEVISPGHHDELDQEQLLKGRILVVDDEESITHLYYQLLTHFGHQVTTVNDPAEALVLMRESAGEYDLVITDYTMPQMTGAELSKKILEILPDARIIMCTGYSEHMDRSQALVLGIREFLMKPVDQNRLLTVIQNELLGARNDDVVPRIADGRG